MAKVVVFICDRCGRKEEVISGQPLVYPPGWSRIIWKRHPILFCPDCTQYFEENCLISSKKPTND